MKIHKLSEDLKKLADQLRQLENVELSDLGIQKNSKVDTDHILVNIHTLSELSKINKSEWVEFLKEYKFDIELNPRASSRDIIGKILGYLAANPDVASRVKEEVSKKMSERKSQKSSALSNALKVLMES